MAVGSKLLLQPSKFPLTDACTTRKSSHLCCIALHPPTADATAICKSEGAVRQGLALAQLR
jgi:hypothetical protein